MTFTQYIMKYPFSALIAFSIVMVCLFFPVLLVLLLFIPWVIELVKGRTREADIGNLHVGNQFMSAKEKAEYLNSPAWKHKREQVLKRDGYKSVLSGATTDLEVHHITYKRLGDELLSDLVTITRAEHQAIHDRLGYDRTTIYNVR